MIAYLVGFIMSVLLFAISAKQEGRRRYLTISIALLIPCLIAGVRASEIGTDTAGYLVPMFQAAVKAKNFQEYLSSSWYHLWRYIYIEDYEIGFSMLVYIISKVFRSIVAVQFVIEVLAIFPIFFAVNRRKEYPVWLCMLVYYLMFYNTSLNLMRQSIAMAFVLLAFQYLSESDWIKYLIFMVVASLFHTSALLGLGIGVIYLAVQKKVKLRQTKVDSRDMAMIIILLAAILIVANINVIVKILEMTGFEKYTFYVSGNVTFMPRQLIKRLPPLLLLIASWKTLRENEKEFRFYTVMLGLDIICAQFTSVSIYGGRIALFFSEFNIMSYAALYAKGRFQKITKIMVLLYLAIYWLFFFVVRAQDSTVPYMTIWN